MTQDINNISEGVMEQTDRELLLELRKGMITLTAVVIGVPDTDAKGMVGRIDQIATDLKIFAHQCPTCKEGIINMITKVKDDADDNLEKEIKEMNDKVDKVKMSVWKLALIVSGTSIATGGAIELLQKIFN